MRPLEQGLTFSKSSLRMNTKMPLFGRAPLATDWHCYSHRRVFRFSYQIPLHRLFLP